MNDLVLDTFAGPGGWAEAARNLGMREVGIELDAAACATRRAAGHLVIRADVAAFPVEHLAGRVWGKVGSPPCTTFSAAGDQAGTALMALLASLIGDMFAGRDTRGAHRAAMAAELARSEWAEGLSGDKRAAKVASAVTSAALVAEPARFIAACRPEWIALEQVPAVLPLWHVYAAELRRMGYSAWTGKLNAADYGVAQTRERAILIASRVRRVHRPEPTHYDPRKGDQLWGTPWVSMAEALGWGATGRPSVAVTAGGTSTGGAEPFGHRGRDALEAERDAGQWALRRSRGEGMLDREGRGGRRDHPLGEPAPTITSAGSKVGANLTWVLHTNRDQRPDGTRQTTDPSTAPAPALTSKSGGQWVLRTSFGQPADTPGNGSHEMDPETRPAHAVTTKAKDWRLRSGQSVAGVGRAERTADEPAVVIIGRADLCAWVTGQDSVRISVQEAAILQSFPPDYPWQGTKTAQFTQVGNAVPPLLAEHVLAMATGINRMEAAA